MSVEGAASDLGPLGDLVERGVKTALAEGGAGTGDNPVAVCPAQETVADLDRAVPQWLRLGLSMPQIRK